jgi:predicted RNA-binding Zn-ribbon protein involved in translation (DUF1610 family)
VVPLLSKVLSQSNHKFREQDFTISCEQCGDDRNISNCTTKADAEVRTYRCSDCGNLLVTIGHPRNRVISGDECRKGTWWSIQPSSELHVRLQTSSLNISPTNGASVWGAPLL